LGEFSARREFQPAITETSSPIVFSYIMGI
jgi:hypothetical protein